VPTQTPATAARSLAQSEYGLLQRPVWVCEKVARGAPGLPKAAAGEKGR